MTGIDSWAIVAATNATADGGSINWAEGQPPSSVNNTARQMLADTRAAFNDLIWFQYGTGTQGAGNLAVPAVYSSGTVFTIAGADVTAAYHVGRRVRAVGVSTGTIYGSISVTSYAPTTTTVTVVWDSGSLSNETLVISLSQIPITGSPVRATTGTGNMVLSASPTFTGTITASVITASGTVTAGSSNLIPGASAALVSGSSNFTLASLATLSGYLSFCSWNNGLGYALIFIYASGTITTISSSNAAGGDSSFDTTNNTASNGGLGIAVVESAGTIYVQTKTSYSGPTPFRIAQFG